MNPYNVLDTVLHMLIEYVLFISASSFGSGYECLAHFTFKEYEASKSDFLQ